MESSKKQTAIVLIILVAITLLVVGGIVVLRSDDNEGGSRTVSTNDTATEDKNVNEIDNKDVQYKDGTYEAVGSYVSPGGDEEIGVSVTLKDGVITDTSAKEKAVSRDGEEYQERFIKGYKDLVVGKNISEIELDSVSGSSLTSGGFNDALEQIAQQAKA